MMKTRTTILKMIQELLRLFLEEVDRQSHTGQQCSAGKDEEDGAEVVEDGVEDAHDAVDDLGAREHE